MFNATDEEMLMSESTTCGICGAPRHPLASYCKRCKKLIDRVDIRRKPDKSARVQALKHAWDGVGFRCHYSGIRLVEDNHRDPRYLTFDHVTPRQEEKVVVTAAVLNDMKSDMTDAEFRAMIIQLASRFAGGKFDENLFNLSHWKR